MSTLDGVLKRPRYMNARGGSCCLGSESTYNAHARILVMLAGDEVWLSRGCWVGVGWLSVPAAVPTACLIVAWGEGVMVESRFGRWTHLVFGVKRAPISHLTFQQVSASQHNCSEPIQDSVLYRSSCSRPAPARRRALRELHGRPSRRSPTAR